jgi:hypothetical protein
MTYTLPLQIAFGTELPSARAARERREEMQRKAGGPPPKVFTGDKLLDYAWSKKRDHTPRNLPAILRSIETKKLIRGDEPSRTEVSKAKTRLEVQL